MCGFHIWNNHFILVIITWIICEFPSLMLVSKRLLWRIFPLSSISEGESDFRGIQAVDQIYWTRRNVLRLGVAPGLGVDRQCWDEDVLFHSGRRHSPWVVNLMDNECPRKNTPFVDYSELAILLFCLSLNLSTFVLYTSLKILYCST